MAGERRRATPGSLALPPGEAHVFLCEEEALQDAPFLPKYEALLTDEERARKQRFRFEKHQHQQLVTRALVRSVLSLYSGVEPQAWRFDAGERGKPFQARPGGFSWLRFNLSNTDGLVVCAVARDVDVGVDVENMERKGETVAIADRYFSESECDALHALPEARQRDRFFRYWTLKESYIKARGLGLAIPLGQFSFDVERDPIGISFDPQLPDDPEVWQFAQWRLSDRHMLAFGARRGRAPDLKVRTLSIVPLEHFEEREEPVE